MALFRVKWPRKIANFIIFILNPIVFTLLDFIDCVMCIFFRYVDGFLEGKSIPCYCQNQMNEGRDRGISKTLFGRKNVFREMGSRLGIMPRNWDEKADSKRTVSGSLEKTSWSDCRCESCVSWMDNGGQRLHVVVKETANLDDINEMTRENVIFLHGFLSSSLFWTETVFPHLSESLQSSNYRLFAVDLLGFGRSPKPRDCLYTLADHLEMVDRSVICEYELTSFHLVAHSMGCIIALALAAKHPNGVKSITLIAPPYFSSSDGDANSMAFKRLAYKTVWPLSSFFSSFMTWYEHLGRFACFIVCRNHRTWERIMKILTCKSELHFLLVDFTRHTHQSAWHTMHNVVCGGAKWIDPWLETLSQAGARITVIQGSWDWTVPVVCSNKLKAKVPDAVVKIITNVGHRTVVLGREQELARDLEHIWLSVPAAKGNM